MAQSEPSNANSTQPSSPSPSQFYETRGKARLALLWHDIRAELQTMKRPERQLAIQILKARINALITAHQLSEPNE